MINGFQKTRNPRNNTKLRILPDASYDSCPLEASGSRLQPNKSSFAIINVFFGFKMANEDNY